MEFKKEEVITVKSPSPTKLLSSSLKHQQLKDWEIATQNLADYFVKKYFDKDAEAWWIAEMIGGVYYINDRFFSLDNMVEYIRYKYTPEQMFEHYDYALKEQEKGRSPICIRDWKKLKTPKIN